MSQTVGDAPGDLPWDSAGIGDRLYHVQHYDLDSRYATSAPSQGVDGTVTLLARATQSLRAWLYDTKTPPNARPSRLDGGLGRRGRANADTLRAVGPARPPETL